jgi:acetoin utilization deacetylase AcuC-like enzyme
MSVCASHIQEKWTKRQAPAAGYEQLCLIHSPAYVETLMDELQTKAVSNECLHQIDGDTYAGPDSLDAALRGAGGACFLVDQAMREGGVGFSAMRPPGHHAEPNRAMGFCLFSSAAIAARYAQTEYGADRVAVLDFDVHHGNGTQAAFWDRPNLLYASSHQMPLYPGTGAAHDRGAHDNIFNLPFAQGTGGAEILSGWREQLLPSIAACHPDLIIVSAGFDAHKDDPLGGLKMNTDDFAALTRAITELAANCCGGRVVSVLEGGYNLNALGASVLAHLQVLAEN